MSSQVQTIIKSFYENMGVASLRVCSCCSLKAEICEVNDFNRRHFGTGTRGVCTLLAVIMDGRLVSAKRRISVRDWMPRATRREISHL